MRSIQDKGKVWFPGSSGPVFALRVEETVFVPGMEEGEIIEYWIDREFLCVDLHDVKGKIRKAKRFSLALLPATPATLFSGFEKTKHADVKVVTTRNSRVEEWEISGIDYDNQKIGSMNSPSFWNMTPFASSS